MWKRERTRIAAVHRLERDVAHDVVGLPHRRLRPRVGVRLASYDRVVKAVNERFDVRGSDLATLILTCFDNNGVVSKNRRKQFAGRVPEAVFDFVEAQVKHEIAELAGADDDDGPG